MVYTGNFTDAFSNGSAVCDDGDVDMLSCLPIGLLDFTDEFEGKVLSDELHNSSVKLVVQPRSYLCKDAPSMEADKVQPGSPSGSSGSSIDFLPATPTQGHYYGYHPTKAPWMHVPYNIPGSAPETYVTQQPQALVVSQPYVASQPRSYVVKPRPPPPPPGSKKSLVIPAPLGQWDKPQAKGLKYRKLGASNQYSMYTTDGFPLAVEIANKALFGSLHCNTKLFDTKVCHLFVSLNEAAALAVLERAQLVMYLHTKTANIHETRELLLDNLVNMISWCTVV